MRRAIGMFGSLVLASASLAMFGLGQSPAWGDKPAISLSPNPLVFPKATYYSNPSPICGCTSAAVTVTNGYSHPQTITNVTAAPGPPFYPTTDGTCYQTYANSVPKHGSCTVEFVFYPTASGTSYSGTGTIDFASGSSLSVELKGSSN